MQKELFQTEAEPEAETSPAPAVEAHHPVVRHLVVSTVQRGKGEDEEEEWMGLTEFVASTPTPDRYSDVVSGPWRLGSYRANPVVPWAHDYSLPPVGRALDVGMDGENLNASIQWDDSPANPLGQTVAHQFRSGFLSAVSVGFRPGTVTQRSALPKEHPFHGEKGLMFSDNELLEISAVPIPANPQALAVRGFRPWFADEQAEAEEPVKRTDGRNYPDALEACVRQVLREPGVLREIEGLLLGSVSKPDPEPDPVADFFGLAKG